MPIFVGTSDIDDIRVGDNSSIFHSVWKGSTRIWARPLLYTLTVGVAPNYTGSGTYVKYGFGEEGGTAFGSIGFVSGHNQLTSDWFKDEGGVSHSSSIIELYYQEDVQNNLDKVLLRVDSSSTSDKILNSDDAFSRLTIGNTVYNRTDASYFSNSSRSLWFWGGSTNPFGTTNGAVKNIRFDKP